MKCAIPFRVFNYACTFAKFRDNYSGRLCSLRLIEENIYTSTKR